MDLPVFRRGLELVSQQLNKLSEGIRAAQITSVIGGTFTRTPGGTTLTINPPPSSGSGGATPADCPFKVTDASIWNEAGTSVVTMQVKIANSTLAGVYPAGMDAETPYYLPLDPDTDFSAAGICYLYLRAIVNDDGVISAEENSLTFEPSNAYKPSGQHIQLIPVAQIEIAPITGGEGKEIVKVGNSCPSGLFPLDNCPFGTEDASDGETLRVLVSNSKIEGVLPNNMEWNVPFIHDLTSAPIQYVHADIKLDPNGAVDYLDPQAIQIYVTDEILPSNAYYQRSVLAMVQVAGGAITSINNYCYSPTVPYTKNCPFEVVDGTVDGTAGIVVRNWQVQGRYPEGMDYNTFFPLPITAPHTYVYCGLVHNADGDILPGDGSIYIETSTSVKANTDTISYTLLSEVRYTEGEALNIWNYCTMPTVSLGGGGAATCPFKVSFVSKQNPGGGTVEFTVSVAKGLVGNRWPKGMGIDSGEFRLVITRSSYVWIRMEFKENNTVLIDGEDAIQIIDSTDLKTNTADVQWVLISSMSVNLNTSDIIITNVCAAVEPNPCLLAWSGQ